MKIFRIITILFFVPFSATILSAQCTEIVTSTNGYDVEVTLELKNVITPTNCPYGYNYNVEMDYDVSFNGPGPASMYTLQATINCGSHNLFVNIPNSPGNGSVITTANPYNNDSDCNSATLQSLGCGNITLQINGPGIPNQNINMDCTPSSLPIELAEFKVTKNEKNQADIYWVTYSELNNDFFTIERSKDGTNWEEIETIDGMGNSSIKTVYKAQDKNPLLGVSYYRLKQTDFNGESSYSQIQSININREDDQIEYTQNGSTISIIGNFAPSDVEVYNTAGQKVTKQVYAQSLSNGIFLDMSSLKTGVYIFQTPKQNFRIILPSY